MKKADVEIVDIIKKRSQYFDNRYNDAVDKQETDFDNYRGKQWDETRKREWKDAGLPTPTNNRIKGKVNLMRGTQAQNRMYFKIIANDDIDAQMPVQYDGETLPLEEVCRRITSELKNIENSNDGEYELSDCCADGLTCGKAYLQPFIYEDTKVFPPKMKIKFKKLSYREAFPDPDSKAYDYEDGQDWFKYTEISRGKLIEMFPEKEETIKTLSTETRDVSDGIVYKIKYQHTGKDASRGEYAPLLLIEYTYYTTEQKWYIVATGVGIQEIQKGKKKQIDEFYARRKQMFEAQGQEYQYKIFMRTHLKWYVASYCSNVLLDQQELPIDEIDIVQYAADRVSTMDDLAKRDIGIVRDLIDQQDSYNRLDGLTQAHLASNAHSGIAAEEGVLVEPNKWKKYLSKPGFVGYVVKGAIKKWTQLFPKPLAEGFFTLAKDKAAEMDETSNIRPELSGRNEKDQSGKALGMMLMQGSKGTFFYFDNFRRTRHTLARKLVKMICYLKDCEYSLLKIVVDDAVESPSARYANQIEQKELFEGGALEGPYGDIVAGSTNLINKDKIIQRWNEVNEFAQWKVMQEQEQKQKEEAEQLAISDAENEGIIPRGASKGKVKQ